MSSAPAWASTTALPAGTFCIPLVLGLISTGPAAQGRSEDRDGAWVLAEVLAEAVGMLVSPGEFYGPAGAGHVRIAVVQPDDRIELVARRLTESPDALRAPPVPTT